MTVMMLLFTIIILKMSAINIFIDENDDYTDDNEFVNLLLFSIIMILKNSIMKILMTLIMLLLIIDGNDDDNIDKDNDIVDENDYIILIIILIMIMIMLTIQELEKTLVLLSSQPQIWSSPQFISSWNSLLLSPFITLISPVSGIT